MWKWLGGLLVALLLCLAVRAWLAHRQVQAQLKTHHQMTPQQISGARRGYLRGLYRGTPRIHRLRTGVLVLWGLCAITLLYGLMGVLQARNAGAGLLPLAFDTGSDNAASFGLGSGLLFGGFACLGQAYLAWWRTQTLHRENARHPGAHDLYATPDAAVNQALALDWVALVLSLALMLLLVIGNQSGALLGAF